MLLRRVAIVKLTAIGVTFTTIPALMTKLELLQGVLGFARMNQTTRNTIPKSMARILYGVI